MQWKNWKLQRIRDPNNAEIFLNLGNAIRKAKPGEGGGEAFQNYQKALEANPNFARAVLPHGTAF